MVSHVAFSVNTPLDKIAQSVMMLLVGRKGYAERPKHPGSVAGRPRRSWCPVSFNDANGSEVAGTLAPLDDKVLVLTETQAQQKRLFQCLKTFLHAVS
jgi:hypothetical protein